MRILVVEDDQLLNTTLCYNLSAVGYKVDAAFTKSAAEKLYNNQEYELIVLDINLPDGNGFDFCRELKERDSGLPVIFLTANDLEDDVVTGFDLGADDYVTKPFSMKILLKRVEAALRHVKGREESSKDRWEDGFLRLDFAALTACRGGEQISITPNEYKMLRVLTENEEKVLTRQTLLDRLWDNEGNFIDDHTLTVTMNRLRAKIEDEEHTYIKTVRGMGYIWTGGR